MLKTNSRQVKERVNNYLFNNFLDYEEKGARETGRSIDDVKNYIVCACLSEKLGTRRHHLESMKAHGFNSLYDLFKNWMQGLPGVLDAGYYYNCSAVELVGDLLEQTKQERVKYTENQAEELMTLLLYKQLERNFSFFYGSNLSGFPILAD